MIQKEITSVRIKNVKEKKDCHGCEDDFYNGNNPHGVKECWKYKSAKIIPRKCVHINQVPPWTQKPELTMSCYRRKQHVYINGDKQC